MAEGENARNRLILFRDYSDRNLVTQTLNQIAEPLFWLWWKSLSSARGDEQIVKLIQ